ncbi:MAG: NAD(+)/NADH kinase [Bdellovibrionales bacterium]|nr:NAD(+)/NADH kinase [Bdellovibrionales bacterium]
MKQKKFSPVLKNVGIIYRRRSAGAQKETKKLITWLQEKSVRVFISDTKVSNSKTKALTSTNLSNLDLLIVLGGDGTYLYAVSLVQEKNIPILGINWGSLGFLTETPAESMYTVLELALLGQLQYQSRSLLKIMVKRKNRKPTSYLALNDIVFERGPYSRLISLLLYTNNDYVTESKADGMIIASPTGSTAYNLAAGGPIMHPDTKALIVTPICPHSLTQRPLVVPENHKICVKIQAPTQKANFMVDGQKMETLSPNDEVIVEVAKVRHTLVSSANYSYYELLRKKLQFGKRI